MKRLSVIGLTLLVAACSTHEVRCNGLQPINMPASRDAVPHKIVTQPHRSPP
jgi:hypothetical protein